MGYCLAISFPMLWDFSRRNRIGIPASCLMQFGEHPRQGAYHSPALSWLGCPDLAQRFSHPAPVRSYSWQNQPSSSVDRNPSPTEEGPAYHSCSAAFNDFDLCLGYWQVLPVQSKKSSSFHHPHRSFHFKNNAFQCQLGQQLLLED